MLKEGIGEKEIQQRANATMKVIKCDQIFWQRNPKLIWNRQTSVTYSVSSVYLGLLLHYPGSRGNCNVAAAPMGSAPQIFVT